MKFQIDEREDIIRDGNSKAILKVDVNEKNAWRRRKEKNNQIDAHENDINTIKGELKSIKDMIIELTNNLKVND